MFLSLKKLSKLTGELTLSWSSFLSLVDSIFDKTFKDLTTKLTADAEREKTQKSSTTIVIDDRGRLAVRSMKQLTTGDSYVDFTLDEEYFSNEIIP